MITTTKETIKSPTKIIKEFRLLLSDRSIECKQVWLRQQSITEFEAIFVVPKENYLSEEFLEIYRLAITKQKETNTKNFSFTFSFMPFSYTINQDKLVSDGYILESD